jgi:Peptidase family S41/N-terminal domain of Peptidase_S41 in eukaryotic IRBP
MTSERLVLALLVVTGGCSTSRRQGPFDQAVAALADKLETSYLIPSVGARYAAMLRGNLAHGAYAAIDDRSAIATRLTSDLLAVAPDGHLRVEVEGAEPPRAQPSDGGAPRRPPPPIDGVKWIADGVAYIRFNEFPGDAATVGGVDRFMTDHADAHALIIDVRTHRGGGMEEMKVMLPFLYAMETPLLYLDLPAARVRDKGPPRDEGPSVREIPGPPGVFRRVHVALPNPADRRLNDVKVYCLTGPRTASAAEHLVLALKRTSRAVLVGERTAGANHFGAFEPLGDSLTVFLPIGRTVDPDTGADWEGVGIAPHVAVPADQALDEALRLLQ